MRLAGVLDEFGAGVDGSGDGAYQFVVVVAVELGLVTAKRVAGGLVLERFGRWLHAPRPGKPAAGRVVRSSRRGSPDRARWSGGC
jgi:hypothetical protein